MLTIGKASKYIGNNPRHNYFWANKKNWSLSWNYNESGIQWTRKRAVHVRICEDPLEPEISKWIVGVTKSVTKSAEKNDNKMLITEARNKMNTSCGLGFRDSNF
jgi:hypothetical protein